MREAGSEETGLMGWVERPAVLRAARWLVMAEAGLLVLVLFVSAWRRLRYPFELDWLEAGTLTAVGRVLHGQPLYAAPTIRYTPFIYAPLYFWVSAAVARVVGLGYGAMRLVSIGSTAGLLAALFCFCWTESPRRTRGLAGCVGVGLFATAYSITAGFLDVGRVDMLSLLLLMLGLWLVRREHLVAAGAVLALAVLTKQGVLPVAVLALCSEWPRPRRLLAGLGTFAACCAVAFGWLAHATEGWSTLFLFRVAAGFAWNKRDFVLALPHEILAPVAVSVALIVAGALLVPPRRVNRAASFYLLTFVGMVPYTAYLRAHAGAAGNADLPAYLWVAFTAAVCVGRLVDRLAAPASLAVLGAVLVQMVVWTNGPALQVPGPEKRALREALIARVRAMPGEVLVLDHAEYAEAAGKPAYADGKALDGLITSPSLPYGRALQGELAGLVDGGRFTALVVDGSLATALHDDRLPADFARVYPLRAEVPVLDEHDQLTEPGWIFVKCDGRELVRGLLVDDSECVPHSSR